MGTVYTAMGVSLDGFVAGPEESGFDKLFAWYGNGEVEVPVADRSFHMSAASAAWWNELMDGTGACVVGRRLFDLTSGWGGNPPVGKPHVVLSHREGPDGFDPAVPFTFVSDGIEQAVALAKETAGDKAVGVTGGTIVRQCLEAGLLDEIWFNLAPVLLGGGVPYVGELKGAPVDLEGPTAVIEGTGVTHLRYLVRK